MPIPKSQNGEMPFLDHLEELRWRIIYSLVAVVVGFGIGIAVALKFDLLGLLQSPLRPYLPVGQKLVYTHPGDPFSIVMQMALTIAIAVALPVILYNVWAFLSPALHRHEKRIVIPVLFAATVLFIAGVAMAYFLVLPMSLQFFFGLETKSLTPMITVEEYFGFLTSMCLTFGAAFEVPILIVGLTAFGIVSPQTLTKGRKFAVVAAWVVAAIITPGDLFTTTLALAIPLYLLYEGSIIVSFILWRKKEKRRAALLAEEEAERHAGAGAPA